MYIKGKSWWNPSNVNKICPTLMWHEVEQTVTGWLISNLCTFGTSLNWFGSSIGSGGNEMKFWLDDPYPPVGWGKPQMMLKCSSDFILWLTFVCATFCLAPHACCDGEHRVEFPDQISDTVPSLLLELHVQCMCVTILNDLRITYYTFNVILNCHNFSEHIYCQRYSLELLTFCIHTNVSKAGPNFLNEHAGHSVKKWDISTNLIIDSAELEVK